MNTLGTRVLEWQPWTQSYDRYGVIARETCPSCFSAKSVGHTASCSLAEALR